MCGGFKPIYTSKEDKLTRLTEESIVANNEQGEKLQCDGFVPSKPTSGLFDLFKRN